MSTRHGRFLFHEDASGAPAQDGNGVASGPGAAAAGPLVVKLGGAAVDDPAKTPTLWKTLCAMHEAHPAGLILVHGGAAMVDRQLSRLGHATERREGIRLTPPEQIDDIVSVLAGTVNIALVGWLRRVGAPAVGLCLGDGGLCRVRKTTRFAFDPGAVGEIVGGDARVIDALLAADFLPVLCSIGLDDDGEPLNINADEAAAGVAALVGGRGRLLLTDVPGVRGADGTVIESLDAAEIDRLVDQGVITGGMIPKVRGALDAARSAGVPATIASWNNDEDLLRLGRGERAGTRVSVGDGPATARLAEPELPALASSAATVSRC